MLDTAEPGLLVRGSWVAAFPSSPQFPVKTHQPVCWSPALAFPALARLTGALFQVPEPSKVFACLLSRGRRAPRETGSRQVVLGRPRSTCPRVGTHLPLAPVVAAQACSLLSRTGSAFGSRTVSVIPSSKVPWERAVGAFSSAPRPGDQCLVNQSKSPRVLLLSIPAFVSCLLPRSPPQLFCRSV